jgi:predicted Zn-dependent protease
VLVAPVRTQDFELQLSRDMLATRSQLDINKVAGRFFQTVAKDGDPLAFKYLLLPHDLKAQSLNYVFATSYGNQTSRDRGAVVSTARLDVSNPLFEHHDGADVTALRVYKLILKSVARVAGLASPDRCVLAFPRSLAELDLKSHEFCAEDRETLVSAGILKAVEQDSGDCVAVSELRYRALHFAAFGVKRIVP